MPEIDPFWLTTPPPLGRHFGLILELNIKLYSAFCHCRIISNHSSVASGALVWSCRLVTVREQALNILLEMLIQFDISLPVTCLRFVQVISTITRDRI